LASCMRKISAKYYIIPENESLFDMKI